MSEKDVKERRQVDRFRKVVKAICRVEGQVFGAKTFDINQRGLGLIVDPKLPECDRYIVECGLPSGTRVTFEVIEKQRKKVAKGDLSCLRVGLEVINECLEQQRFFRELALYYETETTGGVPQRPQDCKRVKPRVQFELPAFARVDERTYRCQTIDLGTLGIGLKVPSDFPQGSLFQLVCLNPNGQDLRLQVRECSRRESQSETTLGCEVVGGRAAYRHFASALGL